MGMTPPLRVGVVGLGRAFTLMLPTFLQDRRVQLVAACDPRAAARTQFTRDFGAPAFDSAEALAAHAEVEVVYIASPHQLHAAHTRVAAAAGRHVLVEKPMALRRADCDAMIADCAAAGVQLVVGHCHSFDTPYRAARALLQGGSLGRVRMIQALNYTDHLYRPRRPEELRTEDGGGVVFSQGSHQVDIVRLLAGSRATRVRAITGRWDATRPTEGAYTALVWFENGAFATLTYSGYGHFDSDAWCGGVSEMGQPKTQGQHGAARRRLAALAASSDAAAAEAALKNDATYGGPSYKPPAFGPAQAHQHFGAVIVSCEHGALRPLPDALLVDGDLQQQRLPLPPPGVPRAEVIDELLAAVRDGVPPLHSGPWARATVEVCAALLRSAQTQQDVLLAC